MPRKRFSVVLVVTANLNLVIGVPAFLFSSLELSVLLPIIRRRMSEPEGVPFPVMLGTGMMVAPGMLAILLILSGILLLFKKSAGRILAIGFAAASLPVNGFFFVWNLALDLARPEGPALALLIFLLYPTFFMIYAMILIWLAGHPSLVAACKPPDPEEALLPMPQATEDADG